MTDRISQLQNSVNELATYMCNATGCLQQIAVPINFPEFTSQKNKNLASSTIPQTAHDEIENNIELFSDLIAKTCRDIDVIASSLPKSESNSEQQMERIAKLNLKNKSQAEELEMLIEQGTELLLELRRIIDQLSEALLSGE